MVGDRTDGPQSETTLDRPTRCQPYEACWLLRPLLGMFVVALALVAVSHVASFFVWALGSVATIAVSRWYKAQFERSHPSAALPSATTRPRRALPPST
ncbi:MAG TPA: hypothetical protein VF516_27095 [Kofleriaceae bacterium]